MRTRKKEGRRDGGREKEMSSMNCFSIHMAALDRLQGEAWR